MPEGVQQILHVTARRYSCSRFLNAITAVDVRECQSGGAKPNPCAMDGRCIEIESKLVRLFGKYAVICIFPRVISDFTRMVNERREVSPLVRSRFSIYKEERERRDPKFSTHV